VLYGFTFSTEGINSVGLADKQEKSNIIEFIIVFFDVLVDVLIDELINKYLYA